MDLNVYESHFSPKVRKFSAIIALNILSLSFWNTYNADVVSFDCVHKSYWLFLFFLSIPLIR